MALIPYTELADAVGQDFGPSGWLTVTQKQINQFASSTLDQQFIHIDEAAAAKTPFGGTIAHGFLSLSLLSYFGGEILFDPKGAKMFLNYGLNKVRFLMAVKVGKRVRCRAKLLSFTEKNPGKYLANWEMTLEIEAEDKPALIAEWMTLAII